MGDFAPSENKKNSTWLGGKCIWNWSVHYLETFFAEELQGLEILFCKAILNRVEHGCKRHPYDKWVLCFLFEWIIRTISKFPKIWSWKINDLTMQWFCKTDLTVFTQYIRYFPHRNKTRTRRRSWCWDRSALTRSTSAWRCCLRPEPSKPESSKWTRPSSTGRDSM